MLALRWILPRQLPALGRATGGKCNRGTTVVLLRKYGY